jgi:hypothetical protein
MAINPMMLPQIIAMGGPQPQMQTPTVAPMPVQPQPQGPDSLAEMTRLLSGDLSGSLTSGDKLLALSGLLRSATRSGRRAGLTPQQVISDLQRQKIGEVQNRLAIEQMRAQAAARQQQEQAMAQFAATLPPEKQALFPGLDAEGKTAMLKEHLSPQPFQIVKSGGENFMVFRDKSRVKLDIPRDVETTEIDTGDKIQIVDKNTNEIIKEFPKQMSPYQAGSLAVAQGNLTIRRADSARAASGGGGGGSSKQPTQITVDGQTTFGVPLGGFRYKLQDGRVVTATPAPKSSGGFTPALPPAAGGPRFR